MEENHHGMAHHTDMGHNTNYSMNHGHHDHMMHSGHQMPSNLSNMGESSILNGTDISLDHGGEAMMHGMSHHGGGHGGEHGSQGGGHGSHGFAHGSHGGDHSTMMSMTFHGGYAETILFSWWKVTEMGEFLGSFFAIFIMALLYEGLKYYRKHLLWKTYTGLQYCAVVAPDKGVANMCADEAQVIPPVPHALERNVPTMMSTAHAWQTALHGVQVLVSYMLMLVFMTYNSWLCAAVVLGSATGYFLFGWRESVVVDFTEHCH